MKNISLNEYEKITGIEPESYGEMINASKLTEDFKTKFPEEYKKRFGDATPEQVIEIFLTERYNLIKHLLR